MRQVQIARPAGSPSMPLVAVYAMPALVLSAFLTETKFVPGIATNLGPFEVLGGLICTIFALHLLVNRLGLERHFLVDICLLMLFLATVSQINVPPERWRWSLIDLGILFYFVVFVTCFYQAVKHYHLSPIVILRWTTYAILVVGPWILYEGNVSGAYLSAAGPFRNRAHMGFYMLTAFWIALLFRLWPGTRTWERWAAHGAMALSLYAVAVSGRRSVYLALLAGLMGIGISFFAARRGKRQALMVTALFLAVFIALIYRYGERYLPGVSFFKERITMVGGAVADAVGPADDSEPEGSFVALQREGALMAVRDHPILGVGWGGFYRSPYSPTGHEMHSTLLRYLAELGIPGLALYVAFMVYLLGRSAGLARAMLHSPYSGTYLVLAIALWSLSLSYLYNRHLSERTFWLLLVLFLALERYAIQYRRLLQHLRAKRGGRPDEPAPLAARPAAVAFSSATLPGARAAGSRPLQNPRGPAL